MGLNTVDANVFCSTFTYVFFTFCNVLYIFWTFLHLCFYWFKL